MTDVKDTQGTQEENPKLDLHIAQLKKKADLLGITYKANVSIQTLKDAIEKAMSKPVGESPAQGTGTTEGSAADSVPPKGESTEDVYNKAMKLVRVIIVPLESTKASQWESDVFCAANAVVGTVKRVIPFNTPWHVEQILLNTIKEKKYQQFATNKAPNGAISVTSRLVNAYNITELPPLTPAELDELAKQQMLTRSLED